MSQRQFDDLTRSVAVTVSRRQVLKTIAGGVLAAATMTLLGGGRAEAAPSRGACESMLCPEGVCGLPCVCGTDGRCTSILRGHNAWYRHHYRHGVGQ
jgi:hypothetical protein